MKRKYYVGHCVKDASLFANVVVVSEKEKTPIKTFKTLRIEITFEKDFTLKELNSNDIELPYYIRERKNKWVFKISHKDQLMPELHRLNKSGFKIVDVKNNSELHRLIALFI